MATSYTSLLGFALPVTGELQGTWGDTVNNSITQLAEDSIAGVATASVAAGNWTLSTTGSGATNEARKAILIPTGSPGVSRNIICPSTSKAYIVVNQSNAAVVVKGAATSGVPVPAGMTMLVAWNGSDFVQVSPVSVDASGNLGLGVTPSAWNSGFRAIQFGGGASFWNSGAGVASTFVGNNYFLNASGNRVYIANGTAAEYAQLITGAHVWYTAPSGTAGNTITFTQAMTLDASGNLGIGTSSPASKLDVQTPASTNGGATFGVNGSMVGTLGSGGFSVNGGAITDFGIRANANMLFSTGSGAPLRMTLDSSGNLGLGVTPSAWGTAYSGHIQGIGWALSTPFDGGGDTLALTSNAFNSSGSTWLYRNGSFAGMYQIYSGRHIWSIAPSGTAGNTISFTQAATIDASGNLLVTSPAGLGYGTGSGGTVTQATSKSTAVTLNKPTGQITMNNAALAAGVSAEFSLSNTIIGANDLVIVNATGFINYRTEVRNCDAGACSIRVTNVSGGSLSEAVVLKFAVIKGATA